MPTGLPSPPAASSPESTPAPTQPPAPTSGLPQVTLERVFPGVAIPRMTGVYQAPDRRWFVTQQAGSIFVIADDPAAQPQVFLDITDRVDDGGSELGLLGLAFARDFAQSRAFYVNYTAGNPRRTVISRFMANAAGGSVSAPGSETVLIEVSQPFSNHNGGQIVFGPDGYLYIGLGDGGGNSGANSQDLGVLLGKVLRIDVAGGAAYSVPSDNPFVSRAGARGEVWAYGLRNPWRFSFDSATGQLWLGDVGQSRREEINLIEKGGNYGWNVMEGSDCLGGGNACDRSGLTSPVLEYATGANCSVTGGFVYRGSEIEALRGAYVYSDYCSGRVWGVRHDGSRVTEQAEIARAGFRVSSLAVDLDGEIYVIAHGDAAAQSGIFKLAP